MLNYQTAHKTIPHQSTADQWFTESQFESYRRLGQHIVEALFAGRQDTAHYEDLTLENPPEAFRGLSTDKLFEELKAKWPKDPPKPGRKQGSQNP